MNLVVFEEHQVRDLVLAQAYYLYILLNVTTPPMVGSTWPRVRSTLESDCLPALSQGTALFRLVVD